MIENKIDIIEVFDKVQNNEELTDDEVWVYLMFNSPYYP